jgi:chromosome segregation ATPase
MDPLEWEASYLLVQKDLTKAYADIAELKIEIQEHDSAMMSAVDIACDLKKQLTAANARCEELEAELVKYKSGFKNEQHKFGVEFLKNEKLQADLASSNARAARYEKALRTIEQSTSKKKKAYHTVNIDLANQVLFDFGKLAREALAYDSEKGQT